MQHRNFTQIRPKSRVKNALPTLALAIALACNRLLLRLQQRRAWTLPLLTCQHFLGRRARFRLAHPTMHSMPAEREATEPP